jgi:hypothetical protein
MSISTNSIISCSHSSFILSFWSQVPNIYQIHENVLQLSPEGEASLRGNWGVNTFSCWLISCLRQTQAALGSHISQWKMLATIHFTAVSAQKATGKLCTVCLLSLVSVFPGLLGAHVGWALYLWKGPRSFLFSNIISLGGIRCFRPLISLPCCSSLLSSKAETGLLQTTSGTFCPFARLSVPFFGQQSLLQWTMGKPSVLL